MPTLAVVTGTGVERVNAGDRVELDIISKRLNEDTPGSEFSIELRGPEFVQVRP